MKVLLVKTSSMGDVVHTLTAVREAKSRCPDLHIDWLVEADFADIAELAKQQGDIHQVIPIRFRQWRKRKPFGVFFNPDIQSLKQRLVDEQYDLVVDAQGLIKSAFLARLAEAPIVGLDKTSVREKLASSCYQQVYHVAKEQHAIHRLRQLFSQIFDYTLLDDVPSLARQRQKDKQVLLFHGTTWDNKRYPTGHWHALAKRLSEQGYRVLLPYQGDDEYATAQHIAKGIERVEILPEQSVSELHQTLIETSAVISVDTGLAHLAVYLGIPTVMLFGPTRPELTGGLGAHTINLVGEAGDTASMKRESYHQQAFSASMTAITIDEILSALARLS